MKNKTSLISHQLEGRTAKQRLKLKKTKISQNNKKNCMDDVQVSNELSKYPSIIIRSSAVIMWWNFIDKREITE